MGAAVDFLTRQWSGTAPPPTRMGAGIDWRNNAVFSFDLAMMVRGLAAAVRTVGTARCAEAVSHLMPWLDRLVDRNGMLMSHLELGTGDVPARWSTRPGPYQAKTAAAILSAPEDWLSGMVLASARRTLEYWSGRAVEHRELHARFYGLEGTLRAGTEIDPAAVLGTAGANGEFPEEIGPEEIGREEIGAGHNLSRVDVHAQALRLLCLLPGTPEHILDTVAANLLRYICDDGSVRFRIGEPNANVWCALFAHQALDWLCHRRGEASAAAPHASAIV